MISTYFLRACFILPSIGRTLAASGPPDRRHADPQTIRSGKKQSRDLEHAMQEHIEGRITVSHYFRRMAPQDAKDQPVRKDAKERNDPKRYAKNEEENRRYEIVGENEEK